LVAARHQDVVVSDVLVGCYSVTVAVKPATNADTAAPNWWLTAVYGPREDRDKAIFLEELEAIRDACQGPWAVTGDFNLILNEEDKSNDRIDRANLRKIQAHGGCPRTTRPTPTWPGFHLEQRKGESNLGPSGSCPGVYGLGRIVPQRTCKV